MQVAFQRILGIDVGSRRIGLALSDPLCITAQPYAAVENSAEGWKKLLEILSREHVRLIVVGMPFNLKGERGPAADTVAEFVERLKAEADLEVITWDERFTTSMAQRTMHEMGVKRRKREARDGTLDSMAASILLQSFLDSTKRSRVC
ncbi:MAG: Holliday junction resolvase RuvX [Bacteroidota bacterium]